jgi:branched-chain amino acid transport system permease protein
MNDKKSGFKLVLNRLKISPIVIILLVIMLILPLLLGDGFYLRLIITSLIFAVLGMGFDFSNGYINILNFGYAAFMGIGAYASGIVNTKLYLSPWFGLIAAIIITGLVGFLLGVLTLRLRGIFAACMAWFLALAVYSITINWVDLTRGSSGLIVSPLFFTANNIPYYYIIVILTVLTYVILKYITNSQIGTAFLAIGQDLDAARASGVNPIKYKVINFTISCMIAGVAGWFYAHYFKILTPELTHTTKTVEILAISYIGGRGSIWGSIIAALTLLPLLEFLKPMMELRLILYGIFLILIMIYYPGGLAKLFNDIKNRFTNKQTGQLIG